MSYTNTIWRYMSLAKFVDLLSTKSIYCCRTDRFEDRTEGEWFSQVSSTSHRQTAQFFHGCLSAIQKVNQIIFAAQHPNLDDIRNAFYSTITQSERQNLNFSDDVSQVTDDVFFDCIEDRLEFLRDIEDKHRELVHDCTLSQHDHDDIMQKIASIKKRCFISSWFSGTNHSIAMWKAYCMTEEGIAITTTKDKLKALARANEQNMPYPNAQFLCADVIYVDESTEDIGSIIPRSMPDGAWMNFRDILLKHSAFSYEQEHRLVLILPDGKTSLPSGVKLDIAENLDNFIDQIYINPTINKTHWFVNVVRSIIKQYGVDEGKIEFGEIRTEYSG